MDIIKILDLENDGLNMAADEQFIYIRCKRTFYKYDFKDMRLITQNVIFKKDGKARTFSICEKYIVVTDFCDLYILDKNNLQSIKVMRLGENLSSDLGNVRFDGKRAYINIRNGKMAVMDLETLFVEKFNINESSSWDHCVINNHIYTGTVIGDLIETDTISMQPLRKIKLCKKNIYSVVYHNGIIYTVSQDMTIKAVNAKTLEIVCEAYKAVKGMTKILGIYKDWLVIADGGISLWNKRTLRLHNRFEFPTGHFNKGTILRGNTLIGSDFHSIYKCTL